MLCQKCGRNEATVNRESLNFRQKVEEHLCELCAGTGADVTQASGLPKVSLRVSTSEPAVRPRRRSGPAVMAIGTADVPHPITVPRGLSEVGRAVARLIRSEESEARMVVTCDARRANVSLNRKAGQFFIGIFLGDPEATEEKLKAYCDQLGLPPVADAADAKHMHPLRLLKYAIDSESSERMSAVVTGILREGWGVTYEDTLNFLFLHA